METQHKEPYEAPRMEVFAVVPEGTLLQMSNRGLMQYGGDPFADESNE